MIPPNTSKFINCKTDLPDNEYWWEKNKELEKSTGMKLTSFVVFVVNNCFRIMGYNIKSKDNVKIAKNIEIGTIKPLLDEEEPITEDIPGVQLGEESSANEPYVTTTVNAVIGEVEEALPDLNFVEFTTAKGFKARVEVK